MNPTSARQNSGKGRGAIKLWSSNEGEEMTGQANAGDRVIKGEALLATDKQNKEEDAGKQNRLGGLSVA